MNDRRYFYACSYPLEPGSIVRPGNWGRILRLESITPQSSWVILREQVFEAVRAREFPNCPSRLEATFLCETVQAIQSFQQTAGRPYDLCYEVELVDAHRPLHRTCMAILESTTQGPLSLIE